MADSGVLLASIDARQVRTFESALQKDNAKAARLAQTPEPERLKKRAQTTLDLVKDWLGALTKEQQAQIREWSLTLPDVQPTWVAYQGSSSKCTTSKPGSLQSGIRRQTFAIRLI